MRKSIFVFALIAVTPTLAAANPARPNIIFVVADDMGWRDTGYRGNAVVKTPNLDNMAAKGIRFEYFYAGQQMCSPGRFAILTGRTPYRTGLHHLGAMRPEEITLAQLLRTAGYSTGHFGKWHLGAQQTQPVKAGFDKAVWSLNYFDLGASLKVDDTDKKRELKGDTSVATMDIALEWIREQVQDKKPFFAQVCFGSPHSPHMADPEFRKLYPNDAKADFWGEISGLDAAVGNLRAELKKLGIADNTIIWFTSDNGGITPASQEPSGKGKMQVGVRTQGLLEWPAVVKTPLETNLPVCHTDMTPTILDIVGVKMPDSRPIDGISLLPLVRGDSMTDRPRPMGFMNWPRQKNGFDQIDFVKDVQAVWIDGKYRLAIEPNGNLALHDIFADPRLKTDLAPKMPEVVARMRQDLDAWRRSVRASYDRKDYPKSK